MRPTLLGFHTFTLCSATGTSNSSDRFSYWIIIWSSSHSLHGGGHLYVPSFVSGRNHEPFLGAFSQVCKLRERLHIAAMIHTSQVCKLENVSHSCIHQHSLSAREAFSIRPSLSQKYSNFVLASGLVKISAICS
jgi:hypothetical protein